MTLRVCSLLNGLFQNQSGRDLRLNGGSMKFRFNWFMGSAHEKARENKTNRDNTLVVTLVIASPLLAMEKQRTQRDILYSLHYILSR
jgi:hypothetical protein